MNKNKVILFLGGGRRKKHQLSTAVCSFRLQQCNAMQCNLHAPTLGCTFGKLDFTTVQYLMHTVQPYIHDGKINQITTIRSDQFNLCKMQIAVHVYTNGSMI